MSVATTILEQLGGARFTMMTGAKNFVGSPNSLLMRLPGTPGFVRGAKLKVVSTHGHIYADALQSLFTRETGLAVTL